eukprot:365799-Chlamydomonas_euryale.AAC.6
MRLLPPAGQDARAGPTGGGAAPPSFLNPKSAARRPRSAGWIQRRRRRSGEKCLRRRGQTLRPSARGRGWRRSRCGVCPA